MKPLFNNDYEKLEWDENFQASLIRLSCVSDGNCYFHAICKAYFKPYIFGKVGDKTLSRQDFVRNLRKDLSKILPKYYDTLAKGELSKIGKEIKEYSLENMQNLLDSSQPLSNEYNEFISDQLDIDIYILDANKRDVYMTGTDDNLIYKDRKSVVLLYLPGHYELIGVEDTPGNITTVFKPSDPIIIKIRNRMNELRKL